MSAEQSSRCKGTEQVNIGKCGVDGGSKQDITVDYDLDLKLKVCQIASDAAHDTGSGHHRRSSSQQQRQFPVPYQR